MKAFCESFGSDDETSDGQPNQQQPNQTRSEPPPGLPTNDGLLNQPKYLESEVIASPSHATKPGGPRTARGKTKSSRNATTHGIFSTAVLLQHESASRFKSLLRGLRDYYKPVGVLEEIRVEKLTVLIWRQRRLLLVETAVIQAQIKSAEKTKEESFLPVADQLQLRLAELNHDNERLREYKKRIAHESQSIGGKSSLDRTELLENTIPKGQSVENLLRYDIL